MICLALGLGVLGFMAMKRARYCHGGHGYRHSYGWPGSPGGWHHHGRGRWFLHAALARIEATPAQERVIVAEVEKLQERLYGARSNMRDARGDLAAAVRNPVLDDAALGAVMGRVDGSTNEARTAIVEALRNIHGVLDDRQRSTVADLIDRSGGGFWRRGPYR